MSDSPTLLADLTAAQLQAATYLGGPALVVAGPGAGKTKTLVARLGYLIASRAARPEELLAVTFTRKAAAELRARLRVSLGSAAEAIAVGTFHAAALLLRPLEAATPGPPLLLLGEAERRQLAEQVVAEYGSQVRGSHRAAADKLVALVSRCKGQRTDWEQALRESAEAATSDWLPSAARRYQALLEKLRAEDLDDLLIAATRAVQRGGAARRFAYVLVDEYQDVNGVQRELLVALAATGASLFAIGDPDQAIYAFRGAEVGHFLAFGRDFPTAKTFFLRENFRSTSTLVEAGSGVIAHNPQRLGGGPAMAVRGEGEKLVRLPAGSGLGEAVAIAREVERLLGGTSLSSHDLGRGGGSAAGRYGFSDIAVLTRTAARADLIAEALAKEGLPILRPRRAVAPAELSPQLAQRLAALRGGVPVAAADEPPPLLPSEVGEEHESDSWDERLQRVAVLTLHGAKGLEFPVVFLAGCEAELLPGLHADAAERAEARRLFYVGMTRARERLYLSQLAGRPPSPFLDELPPSLVSQRAAPVRKPKPPQLKLF